MSEHGIFLRACVSQHHGYGRVGIEFARYVLASGISLRIQNLSGHTSGIPEDLKPYVTDTPSKSPWELVICPPYFPLTDGKRSVYVTMWETTRLHPEWANRFNRCDAVIVPSEFCRTTFDSCGVNTHVFQVPLGVDTSVFKPAQRKESDRFIIGTSGRFSKGGIRKGIQDVIEAFSLAYYDDESVRLQIKVPIDAPVPDSIKELCDDRVEILKADWSDERMSRWYNSLSAYVTASRGEGFGLQIAEAMACGTPVIGISWSGTRELLTPETGLCVEYELKPARYTYDGLGIWAEPNIWSIKDCLQKIGSRSTRLLQMNALERASRFTWQQTCEGIMNVLRDTGFFRDPLGSILPSGIAVRRHDEPVNEREEFAKKFGVGKADIREVPEKPSSRSQLNNDEIMVVGPLAIECGVGQYARQIAQALGSEFSDYEAQSFSDHRIVLLHHHRSYFEKLPIGRLVHDLWGSGHDIWLDVHDPGGAEQLTEYLSGIIYHTPNFTDYLNEVAPDVPKFNIPLCSPVYIPHEDTEIPFTLPDTQFRIGWTGLWNPHKGTDLIIEAVQICRSRGADIGLIAFGAIHGTDKDSSTRSQETFDNCQRLVREWKLESAVTLDCKTLPYDQVFAALSCCDIFCIPYTTGGIMGQSSAALAMLPMGKPILVSNVAMFRDLIEDGGARVLDEDTAVCIADTVMHFLLGQEHGRAQYEEAAEKAKACYADRRSDVVAEKYKSAICGIQRPVVDVEIPIGLQTDS